LVDQVLKRVEFLIGDIMQETVHPCVLVAHQLSYSVQGCRFVEFANSPFHLSLELLKNIVGVWTASSFPDQVSIACSVPVSQSGETAKVQTFIEKSVKDLEPDRPEFLVNQPAKLFWILGRGSLAVVRFAGQPLDDFPFTLPMNNQLCGWIR
jgi:hypothetical protein